MARIEVESEVTGNVWKVEVEVGDSVEEGDVLLILESMKMEIPRREPRARDRFRTAGPGRGPGGGGSGGGGARCVSADQLMPVKRSR